MLTLGCVQINIVESSMDVSIKKSWVRSPASAIVLTWVGMALAIYVGATPGIVYPKFGSILIFHLSVK